MTAFPERLQQLALTLEASAFDDGGWPHPLDMTGSASTIVATAQVLELLRLLEKPPRHPLVKNGLHYLAREVQEQTRDSGRGEYSRYPAYGLWGLMRFPSALWDPNLAEGAAAAYALLTKYRLKNGGWGSHRSSADVCFPVTTVAIHALDRYRVLAAPKDQLAIAGLTDDARSTLGFRNEGRAGARWWPQLRGGSPCAGATALAALSLSGGTEPQRKLAHDGIRWLAANPERWTREVTFDRASKHRPWQILSFSLGLRAVLHPMVPRDIGAASISEVVAHLDDLWDDVHGGWAAEPGAGASTTGSFAVVSAVQALKRAWPFDPAELVVRRPSRKARPHIRADVSVLRAVTVDEARRRVRVEAPRIGEAVIVGFRDASGWRVVRMLAKRHVAHADSKDKNETSVSLDELAAECGCAPDSVRTAISRLNRRFASVYVLVDKHTPGGTRDDGYIIENASVTFADIPDELLA